MRAASFAVRHQKQKWPDGGNHRRLQMKTAIPSRPKNFRVREHHTSAALPKQRNNEELVYPDAHSASDRAFNLSAGKSRHF